MKIKELVKQVLIRKENRRYESLLRHRQGTYEAWLAGREEGTEVSGEAAAPEMLKDNAGFAVICGGKGMLISHAGEKIRAYFASHPEVRLLYGDEDIAGQTDGEAEGAGYESPWFKPDWSPDLLDSFFYFGSVTAMRKELFRRAEAWMPPLAREGGSENGAEIYRIWDLAAYEKWIHICAILAGGYRKGSCGIGHIPEILFHGENREAQDRFLTFSDFLKGEEEALLRDFRDGWIAPEKEGEERKPVISVVIPSKDQPDTLEKCLRGCMPAGRGEQGRESPACEIIIVDNGSNDANRQRVERLVKQSDGSEGGRCPVTYLYRPMEFNFSRMCNLGAAEAKGNFLLFLNDDVELCRPGIITEMAALADREYTGAVGLKLYYPDSVRIQHAGITNLPMGPVHKLQFMEDDRAYYYGANRGKHNVLAVTAACLMVEKDKYLEAGGFSEELKVAFNDVDFCFRLYELGYHNVCVNDRYAYHHESLSRGGDESPEKSERLLRERDKLYERHPGLAGADPYYSPHLNRTGLDTGIRPAYLTAGNGTQESGGKFFSFDSGEYRRDDCLMVRVEDCRGRKVLGYGAVLGDNNACYEKMLLLQRMSGREEIYGLRIKEQYRPDLEENMPDQVNVALCGFDVEIGAGELPPGRYRLGLAARSRVSGLKLMNWSNRFTEPGV